MSRDRKVSRHTGCQPCSRFSERLSRGRIRQRVTQGDSTCTEHSLWPSHMHAKRYISKHMCTHTTHTYMPFTHTYQLANRFLNKDKLKGGAVTVVETLPDVCKTVGSIPELHGYRGRGAVQNYCVPLMTSHYTDHSTAYEVCLLLSPHLEACRAHTSVHVPRPLPTETSKKLF